MTLEEAINHCDEIINNATSCGSFDCADEHRQLKAWLQELKQHRENVNKDEQNIAEWSEEDELMLKQAIYVCHQNGYTAVENWLKSLKPQKQWKPSKEQLTALDSTLQYGQISNASKKHLNSLYNDLKQL